MARYRILYWHHIPSLVEAMDDGQIHKEELSSRFQELIDRIAMKKKVTGTEAYLEGWRKGRTKAREGDVKSVVKAIAKELEAEYDEIAAKDLDHI